MCLCVCLQRDVRDIFTPLYFDVQYELGDHSVIIGGSSRLPRLKAILQQRAGQTNQVTNQVPTPAITHTRNSFSVYPPQNSKAQLLLLAPECCFLEIKNRNPVIYGVAFLIFKVLGAVLNWYKLFPFICFYFPFFLHKMFFSKEDWPIRTGWGVSLTPTSKLNISLYNSPSNLKL